eukprot:m.80075 g.80075  ORF g.80075 m.80075 type:complete len:201 (+) comp36162_c0_seq2:1086-1688(+)
MVLHLFVIPQFSSGYNDDCLTNPKTIASLRHVLTKTVELFDKINITYWLDYGTLLAAVRDGDLIPWDHDADLGYFIKDSSKVREMTGEAAKMGITWNAGAALYQDVSVDFFRYSTWQESSSKEPFLIAKFKDDGPFLRWYRYREAFPARWILPVKRKEFLGKQMPIPAEPTALLSHRYPWTYRFGIKLPYRWKCLFRYNK